MANIKIPQSRNSSSPRTSRQVDQSEAILQVLGQNPMANAIDQITPLLSQAIQRRADLRRQAQQVAALEHLAGQEPGAFNGVPLEVASSFAVQANKARAEQAENDRRNADNAKKIRAFEKQFGYGEGDLGDDLDAAKTRVVQQSISNRQERGMDERGDNQFKTRLNNQKNRMINDPRIKPLYAQNIGLKQVGEIMNLVQGGNTVAAGALGVKMAKAMGEVGVLTDQDVARYVVSGRLDRMAADKLSKWLRGVPSDATQGEIAQIAQVLGDSFSEKLQPVYNEYIESFAEVEGKTPDEVSRMMAIPYKPSSGLKPIPTPAGGGQWDSAKEARYQELLRKRQGR